MDISIRFQVTNESLPSESLEEIRRVVIAALEARQRDTRPGGRKEAIIAALLDEDQAGTIPEPL